MVKTSKADGKTPSKSSGHYKRRNTPHFDEKKNPVVGRYRIFKRIGEGAFGRCFYAKSRHSGRKYCLKIIKAARKYVRAAKEEARVLTKINEESPDGPFVQFYRAFDFGEHYVMVFEPLGKNLYQLLRVNNFVGFPLSTVRVWAKKILKGLVELHKQGMIHTDLKVN